MFKSFIKLIVPVIILSSCGSSGSITQESDQGFQVTYPGYFSSNKDTSKGISLYDKKSGSIIVINRTQVENPKNNNEIIQWYNSNAPIDNSGEYTLNGKKGGFVEFTNKYPKFNMYHRDSWLNDDNNLYGVACTGKESEKENLQKICNDISLSLKIK